MKLLKRNWLNLKRIRSRKRPQVPQAHIVDIEVSIFGEDDESTITKANL